VGKPEVFVTKIVDNTERSMSWLFSKLEMPLSCKQICVKLNLCHYRSWETGATSDPHVVDALLAVLRRYYPTARIFLVENDATGLIADNIFAYLKIQDVAARHDCSTLNVQRGQWLESSVSGRRFHKVNVPEVISISDLFVTHPKLKTHGLTKISCGLKNQFGLLKTKNKITFHKHLDDAIVDANIAMKPHISIVDGNICQEGIGGPCFGVPKKLGLLIASNDVVAADSFCSRLMGFNPYFVGHVRKSHSKEIGNMRYTLVSDFKLGKMDQYHFDFNHWVYYPLKLAKRLMG
jgi:uncharacterized protein (DUF362 family)